jgi:hypothetical protein
VHIILRKYDVGPAFAAGQSPWPGDPPRNLDCMVRQLCAVALASACAPLNAASLSEPCRHAYNSCLNVCPKADPPPSGDTLPLIYRLAYGNYVGVASCTQHCNEQANRCR